MIFSSYKIIFFDFSSDYLLVYVFICATVFVRYLSDYFSPYFHNKVISNLPYHLFPFYLSLHHHHSSLLHSPKTSSISPSPQSSIILFPRPSSPKHTAITLFITSRKLITQASGRSGWLFPPSSPGQLCGQLASGHTDGCAEGEGGVPGILQAGSHTYMHT